MAQERRLIKRHPVKVDATIITPTASIAGIAVDISTNGIRVTSPEPILPETDVVLVLATGEETLLAGTILWTLEIGNSHGMPFYNLGVEIDSVIYEEREAIGFTDRETIVAEIISRIQ